MRVSRVVAEVGVRATRLGFQTVEAVVHLVKLGLYMFELVV
jgi:hypothetical protein